MTPKEDISYHQWNYRDPTLDTFFAQQQARILRLFAAVDVRREDRRWSKPWVGCATLTEFEHRK